MATIYVNAGGTYTANAGDVFIINPAVSSDVWINGAVAYSIRVEANNTNAFAILTADGSTPSYTVMPGVDAQGVWFEANGSNSTNINIGAGAQNITSQGSENADTWTVGDNVRLDRNDINGNGDNWVELLGGNDTLTVGSNVYVDGRIEAANGDDSVSIGNNFSSTDFIDLGNGNDTLVIGTGTVIGTDGSGYIAGGGGNDVITIGGGATVRGNVDGGTGSNTISVGDNSTVFGNVGAQSNVGESNTITLGQNTHVTGWVSTGTGTSGHNTVNVGDGSTIDGRLDVGNTTYDPNGGATYNLGNDVTVGEAIYMGNANSDTLVAGDNLTVGAGIHGEDGDDSITLGNGATVLSGGITGGTGDDSIVVGAGSNITGNIDGGTGSNTISVGDNSTVSGNVGAQSNVGESNTITLGQNTHVTGWVTTGTGTSGHNTVNVGDGSTIDGRLDVGNTTYDPNGGATYNLGNDVTVGEAIYMGNANSDTLVAGDNLTVGAGIHGEDGDDSITLGNGATVLSGGITGGTGDDSLVVGAGANITGNIDGGVGSNTIYVGDNSVIHGSINTYSLVGDGSRVEIGQNVHITGDLNPGASLAPNGAGDNQVFIGSGSRIDGILDGGSLSVDPNGGASFLMGDNVTIGGNFYMGNANSDTISGGAGNSFGSRVFGEGGNDVFYMGQNGTYSDGIDMGDGDDTVAIGPDSTVIGDIAMGSGSSNVQVGDGSHITGSVLGYAGVGGQNNFVIGKNAVVDGQVNAGWGTSGNNTISIGDGTSIGGIVDGGNTTVDPNGGATITLGSDVQLASAVYMGNVNADTLVGGDNVHFGGNLYGEAGSDVIVLGDNATFRDGLYGGDGTDSARLGAYDNTAFDTLDGGNSSDSLTLSELTAAQLAQAQSALSSAGWTYNSSTNTWLKGSGGAETFQYGNATITRWESVQIFGQSDGIVDGTASADTIGAGYIDHQSDAVDNYDGLHDTIMGYAGNDTIDGEAGDDLIYGGSGDDSLHLSDDAAAASSGAEVSGGNPYIVNEDLVGNQSPPQMIGLVDGRVMYVWTNDAMAGDGTNTMTLQGRIMNADGTPSTDQFQIGNWGVEQWDNYDWDNVTVEQAEGGNVIIGFVRSSEAHPGLDTPAISIINPSLNPGDAGFNVATDVALPSNNWDGYESPPVLEALDDGRFMAVWAQNAGADNGSSAVWGRIFDANGVPTGNDFEIGTWDVDGWDNFDVDNLEVTELTDGNVVVSYVRATEEVGDDTPVFSIIDPTMSQSSPGFFVTTNQVMVQSDWTQYESPPVVTALADGGFMATWLINGGNDDGSTTAQGRIFNADGTPATDQFAMGPIPVNGNDWQDVPSFSIETLSNGMVIYGYSENYADGVGTNPHFSIIDPSLNPTDPGFFVAQDVRINDTGPVSTDHPSAPVIEPLPGGDGNFVAVWVDGWSTEGQQLLYRVYGPDGQPLTEPQILTQVGDAGMTGAGFDWANLDVVATGPDTFQVGWVGANDGNGTGVYTSGPIHITFIEGTGDDTIYGGETDEMNGDTLVMETVDFGPDAGYDVVLTGEEQGTATDVSSGSVTQFYEIENFQGSAGNDTIDAGATTNGVLINSGVGADIVVGGAGNDTLNAASYASQYFDSKGDTVNAGDGNDLIGTGGTGHFSGESGDDTFLVGVSGGMSTVVGGETGETQGDTLDFTNTNGAPANVSFTGAESGQAFLGTSGPAFSEIENFVLTSANDTVSAALATDNLLVDAGAGSDLVTTGSGDDTLQGGDGADTLTGGAGNDAIDFGAADGDTDVAVLANGSGEDVISGFEAPTANGDGTFTGKDQLDVSGLDNAAGDPVGTADVQVVDDGNGNAMILFPNGESVVLEGVDPATANDADFLEAIGIPNTGDPINPDGVVDGTAGDDSMGPGYMDPDHDYVDGPDGNNDSILGGAGNDTINAGLGDDTVDAGVGNDSVLGGDGNDSVLGGDGNDTLGGGLGDDTLLGDAGADSLTGNDGNDSLVGGVGNDTLDGGANNDTLDGGDGADSILGGLGNDSVLGGLGSDTINAGDGNDTVNAGGDNDSVLGGAGNDSVIGDLGNDTLLGEAGNDTLDGGAGNDSLIGGAGNDSVLGGAGDDTMSGGDTSGNDTIYGGDGNDLVNEMGGTDLIYGGSGNDTIDPGYNLGDTVYGGDGNDQIVVHASENGYSDTGNNTSLSQGDGGDDTFVADAWTFFPTNGDVAVVVGGETGETNGDTLDLTQWGSANVVFTGDEAGGIVTPSGDLQFSEIENFVLSNSNDTLNGAASNAPITVDAGAGSDSVIGGTGADSVAAGTGNDTVVAGAGNDTVDAGDGNDSVQGGLGNDSLLGGGGSDTLVGGAGADTLNGGDGDDDIFLGGADSALGGSGDDVFTLDTTDPATNVAATVDGGTDATSGNPEGTENGDAGDTLDLSTVAGGVSVVFGADPESGTVNGLDADAATDLTFSEIENVLFGAGNDTIDASASAAPVEIDAGAGDDSVLGGAGNDSLLGGDGTDTLAGGAGDDALDLGAADGAVDTVVFGDGDGNDTLSGFEAPIDNGDGTFTPQDQLDVSGLTDASGNPINTNDVSVGDDGNGNAVLSFPNGETITLEGVDPATAANPDYLAALGIPDDRDGIVDGTTGADSMGPGYTDADGDVIGAGNDSILAGAGNDTIDGGAGSDTIDAGDGNDVVIGNAGDDSVLGGLGNDTLGGGLGNDTLNGGDGADSLTGNEGADSLVGGAGNDTIDGGADNDTVSAGVGDDSIFGGVGNDSILGSEGSDTVDGGDGDDYINTRTSPGLGVPDTGLIHPTDPALSYPADTDPNNDRDSVLGGAGNDTILTGDDDDTIDGGLGNDVIDAGFDADLVYGGAGNDSIQGGEGADTVDGGSGNDVIYGGISPLDPNYAASLGYELTDDVDPDPLNNTDSLVGGEGDDRLYGQDDADTLEGGSGNDTLDGGIDDDSLDGGAGNDSLIGGDGADLLAGGTGNDSLDLGAADEFTDTVTFSDGGGNDTIFGFEAPIDNGDGTYTTGDKFDVSGLTDADGNPVNASDVVVSDDGNGNALLTFPNGETMVLVGVAPTAIDSYQELTAAGIPCFVSGTMIETIDGPRPIESLVVGDLVETADHGFQPLRWIGARTLGELELLQRRNLRPIRIAAGALGSGLPERDLLVSPQHRMLVQSKIAMRMFGKSEVLVAAKQLLLIDGVDIVEDAKQVTYFHMLFDQHQIVFAEGALSESLYTGPEALLTVGKEAIQEILQILPELRVLDVDNLPTPARPLIRGRLARKFAFRHQQNSTPVYSQTLASGTSRQTVSA